MIDQAKVRALLLEGIHPDAVSRLKADAFDVELLGRALDEDELIDRIGEVRVLGIRSKTKVSAKVLAAAPNLLSHRRLLHRHRPDRPRPPRGVGVAVFNAPFSNTRSVVELALGEIIAMTRRLTEKNTGMHNGVWDKAAEGSHEVRGRRSASSGTATSAPSCPSSPRTSACGCPSSTPRTSWPWATPNAATPWTNCSRCPTW